MTSNLAVYPILIPLIIAIIQLLFARSAAVQRVLGVFSSALMLIAVVFLYVTVRADGIQVYHMSNWPAPFGIIIVADLLACFMVFLSALASFAMSVYALVDIDKGREKYFHFPLFQLLLMGINGAFLTGDIFNLFVMYEVMLMASYVLLSHGSEARQLRGSLHYVMINLFGSTFFLFGIGLLYGMTGTLNMADIAVQVQMADPETRTLLTSVSMLLFVVFGVKTALVPLFFWMPDAYPQPPVATAAMFAAIMTKVGVYSIIRTFTLMFPGDDFTLTVIKVVAAASMLIGVLGAIAQTNFRRLLSFHSVSQVGFMVLGLGFFSPMAIAGSIYFVMHHNMIKSSLFLCSGIAERLTGKRDIKKMGGIVERHPFYSALFMMAAFSLAGLPPFSGFFAKLILLFAGFELKEYWYIAAMLVGSFLTLFSMVKIWQMAYWGKRDPEFNPVRTGSFVWGIIILVGMSMVLAVCIQPIYEMTLEASHQLLDPSNYIEAVLGPQDPGGLAGQGGE
jgi:multicomponent Na+:H+ antiporter subunit D